MTDQERMQAYNDCWQAYQNKINKHGIGFVFDVLTGNMIGAGVEWASIVIKEHPDCLEYLSDDQLKAIRDQAAKEQLQRMRDREPR